MKEVSAEIQSIIQRTTQHPIILIEIELLVGTLRYALFKGNIIWGGNTYTAKAIKIGKLTQKAEGQIQSISLKFDNVTYDMSSWLNTENFYGRTVTIRRIFADPTYLLKKEDTDLLLMENADFIALDQEGGDTTASVVIFKGELDEPDSVDQYWFAITATQGKLLSQKAFNKSYTNRCNHLFGDEFCNLGGLSDLSIVSDLARLDEAVTSGATNYIIDTDMSIDPEITSYSLAYTKELVISKNFAISDGYLYLSAGANDIQSYSINESAPSITLVDTDSNVGTGIVSPHVHYRDGSTRILIASTIAEGINSWTLSSGNMTYADNIEYYKDETAESEVFSGPITSDSKYIYIQEQYVPDPNVYIPDPTQLVPLSQAAVGVIESDASGNLTGISYAEMSDLIGIQLDKAPNRLVVMNSDGDAGTGTTIVLLVTPGTQSHYVASSSHPSGIYWTSNFVSISQQGKSGLDCFTVDAAGTIAHTDDVDYNLDSTTGQHQYAVGVAINDTDIYILKRSYADHIDRYSVNGSGVLTLQASYDLQEGLYYAFYGIDIDSTNSKLYIFGNEGHAVFDIEGDGSLTFDYGISTDGIPSQGIIYNEQTYMSTSGIGIDIYGPDYAIQDDYWKYGQIDLWIKGLDVTTTVYCNSYSVANNKVFFDTPLGFSIDNTYTYNIRKGCDQIWNTCGGLQQYGPNLDNRGNFLGFIHIGSSDTGSG